MCRGAISTSLVKGATANSAKLTSIATAVSAAVTSSGDLQGLAKSAAAGEVVYADRLGMGASTSWGFVAEGIQSMAVFPMAEGGKTKGLLFVLSERPRALSKKERGWVGGVATKLASFL